MVTLCDVMLLRNHLCYLTLGYVAMHSSQASILFRCKETLWLGLCDMLCYQFVTLHYVKLLCVSVSACLPLGPSSVQSNTIEKKGKGTETHEEHLQTVYYSSTVAIIPLSSVLCFQRYVLHTFLELF